MTDGIDTAGVTLVVFGTAITTEVLTTNLLVQTLKMVGMAPLTAPTMASLAMAMDSRRLPTQQQRFQSKATSRPRMVLSLLQPMPHLLSLRHKHHHSTLHHWCPTQCLLSSLSKNPYT